MQVRGAKRKFGGIHIDPYNERRRKHRLAEFTKFQKKPLVSEERLKKKIDLPYNVTSLSAFNVCVGGGGRCYISCGECYDIVGLSV